MDERVGIYGMAVAPKELLACRLEKGFLLFNGSPFEAVAYLVGYVFGVNFTVLPVCSSQLY